MHAPAPTEAARSYRTGLIYGLAAYLLWGVLPIYFHALTHVSAGEILSHRIVWSLIFLAILVIIGSRWSAIRTALATPRVRWTLVVTSILIAINWLVFIFAVVSGQVLEGSLGYYLNPLVSILLGVVLLGERLTRAQIASTALAAAGVVVLAAGAGAGLWISLTLAASFATYGYLRKVAEVEALEGLTIETTLLVPIALGYLWWSQSSGSGGLGRWDWPTVIMLVAGGAITTIPLLLFTAAARRLPLSTLGFLQYIAPTLQFACAVLLFDEQLTTAHIICFALIWVALGIFTADSWRRAVVARQTATETLAEPT